MADDQVSIGIGGDITPLQESLDSLPSAAETAAAAVNSALDNATGPDRLTSSVQEAASALEGLSSPAQDAATALKTQADATDKSATAADDMAQKNDALLGVLERIVGQLDDMGRSLDSMAQSEKRAADQAEETGGNVKQMAETIEHAKEVAEAFIAVAFVEKLGELAEKATEAYGEEERLTTALTLMGGSAGQAKEQVENLKEMSIELGLNMSTVETAAQRLSVVFGSGEGMTAALKAAADVSAVTGQSFDAVSSAIQRVAQTGQVSSRQIVQLGLSWSDVATAMGTSIEEAQAKLKKGGQEAAEDVEVLLTTIKSKFGDAAAAQAQGIIGQIQSLKSQIEQVFEQLGAAIAPTMKDIVGFISTTIIPAIKELISNFAALPGPAKDTIVIVGGLATALVPLVGALGALGIAINGFMVLAERLPGILGTNVVAFEGTAVAATHAAEAETAAGSAATGAAGGMNTMAIGLTALTVAAGAFILVQLAGAIAKTTDAIKDQVKNQVDWKQAWSQAQQDVPNVAAGLQRLTDSSKAVGDQILRAANLIVNYGQATKDLATNNEILKTAIDKVSTALDVIGSDFDKIKDRAPSAFWAALGPVGELQSALKGVQSILADLPQKMSMIPPIPGVPNAKQLQIELTGVSKAFADVIMKTRAQETETENLKGAVDLATKALANNTITTTEYQKVVDAYDASLKRLEGTHKDLALSFDQLRQKVADANTAFTLARSAFVDTLDAVMKGKASLQDLAAAYDQAQQKATAAGKSFYEVNAAMDAGKTAAENQLKQIDQLGATYKALKASGDDSVTGQMALAEAQKKLESAAKSLGIEITALGNGFEVSLSDKAGKASAGVQAVADYLTKLLGPTNLVYVELNGKLVPTMKSLADASDNASKSAGGMSSELVKTRDAATGAETAIRVLKGTASETAASFDAASVKVYGFGDDIKTAADLLSNIDSKAKKYQETNTALAASIESVASATNDEASAFDRVSSAMASASAKGNSKSGGGGGDTGLDGLTMSGGSMYRYLSFLRQMGALPSQIDAAANALGLIKFGEYTYYTPSDVASMGSISFGNKGGSSTSSSTKSTSSALDTLTTAAKTFTGTIQDATDAYNTSLAAYRDGTGTLNAFLTAAQNLDTALNNNTSDLAKLQSATSKAATTISDAATAIANTATQTAAGVQAVATAVNAVSVATTVSAVASQAAAAAVEQVSPVAKQAATGSSPFYGVMGTGALYLNVPVTVGTLVGSGGMDQLASILSTKLVAQIKSNVGLKLVGS